MKTAWKVLALLLLVGCEPGRLTGPEMEPEERFGAVTALIDGRAWVSSFFPDSGVAFYSPRIGGRLQITGQEVRSGVWPTLHLVAQVPPEPGRYAIGSYPGSVVGEWYTSGESLRPRAAEPTLAAYLSNGAAADSLVVEEWDTAAGVIRGHFQFTATQLRGHRTITIRGRFAGRVQIVP